jgi:hypothetical protein
LYRSVTPRRSEIAAEHLIPKNTLGDDFRGVRGLVFGTDDGRQLADIRRSQPTVGGARAEKLAKKMANTISASTRLQKVYNPVDVSCRAAHEAANERLVPPRADLPTGKFRLSASRSRPPGQIVG